MEVTMPVYVYAVFFRATSLLRDVSEQTLMEEVALNREITALDDIWRSVRPLLLRRDPLRSDVTITGMLRLRME